MRLSKAVFVLARERTELLEKDILSQFATPAAESAGRKRPEKPDKVRTCFQRDRDRILHSKSFRRLMNKTQVFIAPEGDHYRTRLTHTLEVAQVARTISRALRLNEDLTEAIALGHDVGHTPFGHAGESALSEALLQKTGNHFKHYEQSLRIVTVLEDLNLTKEALDGISGHSKGREDLTAFDGELSPSLEAAVVRISDRIAYLNHDIDDAVRAGWLDCSKLPDEISQIALTHSGRISAMVVDIIDSSEGLPFVGFSPPMLEKVNALKEFLFENVYLEYPRRLPDVKRAMDMVADLFEYYCNHPLPEGFDGVQGAVDYVSGMTDRFAIATHRELFG